MKIPKRLVSAVITSISSDTLKDQIGDNVVTVTKAALSLGDSREVALLCGILIGSLPLEEFTKIRQLVNSSEAVKEVITNTAVYFQE